MPRGIRRQGPLVSAVAVAAVARADAIGGLVSEERRLDQFVERPETAGRRGEPDERVVDDQEVVCIRQPLDGEVPKVLEATGIPDNADIWVRRRIGHGGGDHRVVATRMVPADPTELDHARRPPLSSRAIATRVLAPVIETGPDHQPLTTPSFWRRRISSSP